MRAAAMGLTVALATFATGRAQDTTFNSEGKAMVASLKECDSFVISEPDPAAPERLLEVPMHALACRECALMSLHDEQSFACSYPFSSRACSGCALLRR